MKIQPKTKLFQPEMPLIFLIGACVGVRRRKIITFISACFAMLVLLGCAVAQASDRTARSHLELRSSDARLVQSFNWAKQQAMDYAYDGDPVGPWYEASLPGRRAFCMRDVSHQVAGAHALGLSRYTHNMLRRFAENISASKDWCSYWEINNLGHPAPIDFKSDTEFWYNLPANFDVLDACYRMYLWTGDRTYIEDPVFLNFYDHSVTDYVSRWDLGIDRIMTRRNPLQTPPFFHGDPSYEESRRDVVLGLDLLATQYAGYRSYAAIQAIRGDAARAQFFLASALDVKRLVNTDWWNPSGGFFYALLDVNGKFHGRAGVDLLYRDVAEDGVKTQSALDTLLTDMRNEPASAVEVESHYPEVLYRYGKPDAAYEEIVDLTRTGRERREYPEVSYSTIGAIVNGLMGINVEPAVPIEDVAQGKPFEEIVQTLPQLTSSTSWVELRNLPIGNGLVTVRHDGNQKTVLTNMGKTALTWEAEFSGSYPILKVNGKPIKSHVHTGYLGLFATSITVTVPAGNRASVEVLK
jgi:hypothetical protein